MNAEMSTHLFLEQSSQRTATVACMLFASLVSRSRSSNSRNTAACIRAFDVHGSIRDTTLPLACAGKAN